jgi:ferredoxin
MPMDYVPQVDENACAAHGDCVELAPAVFALNDVAHVIGDGPSDLIIQAAEACPSVAITVIDAETGEQVYP